MSVADLDFERSQLLLFHVAKLAKFSGSSNLVWNITAGEVHRVPQELP